MRFKLNSFGNSSSFVPNTIDRSKSSLNTNDTDNQFLEFINYFPNLEAGLPPLAPPSSLRAGSFYVCIDNQIIDGVQYKKGDIALAIPSENKYVKIDRQNLVLGTDLSVSNETKTSLDILSSTGEEATLNSATLEKAGLLSSVDYSKLVNVEEGAQKNIETNLDLVLTTQSGEVQNNNGRGFTIPESSVNFAGLMSVDDKTKLNGIESGAEPNVTPSLTIESKTPETVELKVNPGNSVTFEAADDTSAGLMSSADRQKLYNVTTEILETKGQPFGIASLDINEKVPPSQMYLSSLNLKGSYDAEFNVPNLQTKPLNVLNGDFWLVNVAGTQQLYGMSSPTDFEVGDYVVYIEQLDSLEKIRFTQVPTNLGIEDSSRSDTKLKILSSSGSGTDIPLADFNPLSPKAGLISGSDLIKLNGISTGAEVNVPTNLGKIESETELTITNDNGDSVVIDSASTTKAGLMSKTDKDKLDTVLENAQPNVPTNLTTNVDGDTITVNNDNGTGVTLSSANLTFAGLLSATDKNKLDGIEESAQENVTPNISYEKQEDSITLTITPGNSLVIEPASEVSAGVMATTDKQLLNTNTQDISDLQSSKLSLSGGSMSGPIVVSSDLIVNNFSVVNRKYVDQRLPVAENTGNYLVWKEGEENWTIGGTESVNIGKDAGSTGQGAFSVAVGIDCAKTNQKTYAVGIGYQAGEEDQKDYAVAIGYNAGNFNQGSGSVAIGKNAGTNNHGDGAISIGEFAGSNARYSTSIGWKSGSSRQGDFAVSCGFSCGNGSQGESAVAIGKNAGNSSQGNRAIAIGESAGSSRQGENSVAIGNSAGFLNQKANTIVLNATGSSLSGDTNSSAFYVKPIRSSSSTSNALYYNTSSGEITYKSCTRSSKNSIFDLDTDLAKRLYTLRPRSYKYNGDGVEDIGFIAEEVHEAETKFASYQDDKPVNINWNAITTALVSEVQSLRQELEELKTKIPN